VASSTTARPTTAQTSSEGNPVEPGFVAVAADDSAPLLGSPLRSSGARPRWFVVVLAPVVVGGLSSAVISPEAGLPMAVATLLAVVAGYGRVFLAVGAVGLLVAVDRIVTSAQDKFHYVAEFGWPTHFELASTLAWFAVAALGADALVQEVRDRRARRLPARRAAREQRRGKHLA
jgi:hypothetical protein